MFHRLEPRRKTIDRDCSEVRLTCQGFACTSCNFFCASYESGRFCVVFTGVWINSRWQSTWLICLVAQAHRKFLNSVNSLHVLQTSSHSSLSSRSKNCNWSIHKSRPQNHKARLLRAQKAGSASAQNLLVSPNSWKMFGRHETRTSRYWPTRHQCWRSLPWHRMVLCPKWTWHEASLGSKWSRGRKQQVARIGSTPLSGRTSWWGNQSRPVQGVCL